MSVALALLMLQLQHCCQEVQIQSSVCPFCNRALLSLPPLLYNCGGVSCNAAVRKNALLFLTAVTNALLLLGLRSLTPAAAKVVTLANMSAALALLMLQLERRC